MDGRMDGQTDSLHTHVHTYTYMALFLRIGPGQHWQTGKTDEWQEIVRIRKMVHRCMEASKWKKKKSKSKERKGFSHFQLEIFRLKINNTRVCLCVSCLCLCLCTILHLLLASREKGRILLIDCLLDWIIWVGSSLFLLKGEEEGKQVYASIYIYMRELRRSVG